MNAGILADGLDEKLGTFGASSKMTIGDACSIRTRSAGAWRPPSGSIRISMPSGANPPWTCRD